MSALSATSEAVDMSLGLSLAASTHLSQLLVSVSGSLEGLEGEAVTGRAEGAGAEGKGGGVLWGRLTHAGLCPQACGPTAHKACGENVHVKGTCLLLDSRLQMVRTVPAAPPGTSPRGAGSGLGARWSHSCQRSLGLGSPPPGSLFPGPLVPRAPSQRARQAQQGLGAQSGLTGEVVTAGPLSWVGRDDPDGAGRSLRVLLQEP